MDDKSLKKLLEELVNASVQFCYYPESSFGALTCGSCDEEVEYCSHAKINHDEDCSVLKAEKILEEMK